MHHKTLCGHFEQHYLHTSQQAEQSLLCAKRSIAITHELIKQETNQHKGIDLKAKHCLSTNKPEK